MKIKTALIVGALLLAGIVGIGMLVMNLGEYEFKGTVYENSQLAPKIELSYDGGEFRLSEFKGKVVMIFFGYTSCPDICPTTLSDMRRVKAELGELAEDFKVVFISVDPGRDTPEKVGEYVKIFGDDFYGLTGEPEDLQPIWDAYGVYAEIDDSSDSLAGYLVNHTSRLYLIDPEGNLLITYGFGTPYENIVEDVRFLIRNSS